MDQDNTARDLMDEILRHLQDEIDSLPEEDSSLSMLLNNIVTFSLLLSHLHRAEAANDLKVLRDYFDEVVEDHVEFQTEELKKRLDRVLTQQEEQIERINNWRDRFENR